MKNILAACLFLAPFPAFSAADVPFDRAMAVAYDLLGAEVSSPFCQPTSITQEQRDRLVLALGSVTTPGLSDETGLTPLDYAVFADDVPSIKRFLTLGYRLNSRDIHESTPLHGAALLGSVRALNFLLASGSDPNSSNNAGFTPLMAAVLGDRADIARSLLAAGASVTSRTTDGHTILHYALTCRDEPLIKLLLAAGAEPDDKARELATKFGINLAPAER